MILYSILFIELIIISVINSENIYDVTKYGADSKGIGKSSEAIKKAIDEASIKGGGTVYFPNGEYLTGPIHLKSNISLNLADNATVKFSKDFDDYLPMVRMRWEGTEFINFSPLIYAFNQTNISITGKGVLDGQGSYWWSYYRELETDFNVNKQRNSKYQKEFLRLNNLTEIAKETVDMTRINLAFLRPSFIQPFYTKDIVIRDVTIKNSPFWNINPVYCDNLRIEGVKIEAPVPSPNTDGIDPDSCRNVYISRVVISVGDDCIALNSGRDIQGRRIGRPTENVVITDSHMFLGHSGVAIGSAMSGGIRNVTVSNCVFNGTNRGLYIKSARGRGGVVEDIHYHNISMAGIVNEAILISLSYSPSSKLIPPKPEPFSERTPTIRNVEYRDIRGSAKSGVVFAGLQESLIDSIKLRNIEIHSTSGLTLNYTKNVEFNEISQKSIKNLN